MARDGERGRGDWKARRGSQNSDPYAEASGDTGPVDIAAVRRDDALIDAIAGDGPVATDSAEEFQLASLLANWRAELVEAPMPAGPSLDTIVAAVNQEIGARQARVNGNRRGHLRLVRPIMGAAAALALIVGGMTAFSYNAQPGDPLWRVKEVVFSEQAQTTISQRADDSLGEAKAALAAGDPAKAKEALESAQSNATQVSDPARKSQLEKQLADLIAQLPPDLQKAIPVVPRGTSESTAPNTPPSKDQTVGGTPGRTVDPRSATAPGESGGGTGTEPNTPVPPAHSQPPTVPPTAAEPPPTGSGNEPPQTQEPTVPTTIANPGGTAPGGSVPGGSGTGGGTGASGPTGPATQPNQPPVYPTGSVPTFSVPGGVLPGGVR
ncbi:anti-sigma-D factor RsdA [Nocardia sp. NPDC003482]|uniref:anti-sigma-D factor RsdA n=1 Tax=Nocardia sp. NPDC004068 TaxID=3364303 RepID=UPI0036792F80